MDDARKLLVLAVPRIVYWIFGVLGNQGIHQRIAETIMTCTVKAWHVFDGDPHESSLLVFAASANRARQMALHNGTWDYEDYISIRVIRAKEFDGCFDREFVVDSNDDLPANAPRFYDDDA